MNEREGLSEQLQQMIRKAFRSLKAAQRHIEEGDYDFASSRAYYAAFYAMQAILLTENLSFSKHAGVISAFNQHFVRTATFPKEFSKIITRLFRERQAGDYGFDLSISKHDAQEDIQIAETVVRAITTHLIRVGFLQTDEESF
jgi:uncharacterized protein (UPF0332 family)